jgi:hypothetical protein
MRRKSPDFEGKSDEQLRARIIEIRQEQRAIRTRHGGTRFRDVVLAEVDAIAAQVTVLAAEKLQVVAVEGNPRSLGGPAQTVSPAIREAALLDWIAHGGFLDRLRAEIVRAGGFASVTSTEMAGLLGPLDDEVRAIEEELARRHAEKVALRQRLRQLEVVEA